MPEPMAEGDRVVAVNEITMGIVDVALDRFLAHAESRGVDMPFEVVEALVRPAMHVAVGATAEHFTQFPEHLALSSTPPVCESCQAPVAAWDLNYDSDGPLKVARPCDHVQPRH